MKKLPGTQDDSTKYIEQALTATGFTKVDAYRKNPAVIHVRIIDQRFLNMSDCERDDMVSPYLDQLPREVRDAITYLLMLAPAEIVAMPKLTRRIVANVEFEGLVDE